jgi:glycosyltransferase involved in cell wall biosynthesis
MNHKPRVAIVAAGLDILGGQGVQAQGLLDALRSDGCEAALLPINPAFPAGARWVRRVPYLRTMVNQALYLPSLVRLSAVDVVHVFSASYWSFLLAPVPAMIAGRMLGKRVVLHYHSGEADDHLARWGALVHPWLRLADEIVVPSEYLAGVFGRYGYRATVIPNIVDLSRFEYRVRHPFRPRLLSTRNLEPYYRVDVILEAFARIRGRHPDATLVVAGYGSEAPRLRRLAVDGVTFAGKVSPEVMPALCDRADIFVNASVVDNQPVSILEAFASGLPVVSTPTGDIPAMVRDNETGSLVPVNDSGAMAAAIERLLADPGRALEMAARARAYATRHTWTAIRDEWNRVYLGHINRPPFEHAGNTAVWTKPPLIP